MNGVFGWRLRVAGGVGLMLTGATDGLPQKGQPPLTAQTARTGGPIDPGQAILVFDQADLNKVPVVSGKSRSGSDLDDSVSGPGQDVYVKASWMLHTLRHLIGDRDFWTVTRLAVYGRTDPKPGNFVPRYGSTKEYEALVRQVTGKDYAWFFDVYLRQAQLPELIATRDGGRLKVSWKVPHGLPFPMPVEVQVDGRLRYLKMVSGSETIVVPPTAHVVLDPEARVLKQSEAADNYRKWQEGLRKGA